MKVKATTVRAAQLCQSFMGSSQMEEAGDLINQQ